MRRRACLDVAILVLLLATGCASGARARQRAFIDAGAEVRKRATGQTYDEVRRELELFLDGEVDRVRQRAHLQREHDLDLYRKVFLAGSAVAVLGLTSGTLLSSDLGWLRVAVPALGIATAASGLSLWRTRTAEMSACEAFLDRSEVDLRAWGRVELRGSAEPVPHGVWEDFVARTAAIRRHDDCLRARD